MSQRGLERNLKLYPWFAMVLEALFFAPVFFLLFSSKFPLEQVLQLEGIYYLAVVILEVPSGYFSDRLGRKPTLIISALCLACSYLLFFTGTTFELFALAKVLMAIGFAFKSGTDASFHYDSHQSLGITGQFGDAEAHVASLNLRAAGIAALIGGFAGMYELSLPFAFSAVGATIAAGLMATCVEPTKSGERSKVNFGRQLGNTLSQLRDWSLAWLLGVAVLSIVLVHVPYELYQPYVDLIWHSDDEELNKSPIITGIHAFIVMLIGSWVAARSMKFRRRFGLRKTFLLSLLLQNLLFLPAALLLHPAVVFVLLFRNAPKGLYMAPLSEAVNERIPTNLRATYLSVQSLAGRLAFASCLLAISLVVGDGKTDWTALSLMAKIFFGVGAMGWIILLLTARFVKDKPPDL